MIAGLDVWEFVGGAVGAERGRGGVGWGRGGVGGRRCHELVPLG